MASYKNQHIVPRSYLKYFSENLDGKNIFVFDGSNKYNREIQKRNSGDAVFYKKNFYDDKTADDPKWIEKFLGNEIDSKYSDLMDAVYKESKFLTQELVATVLKWCFFSKLRSPIWRHYLQFNFLRIPEKDRATYSKEAHLLMFDEEIVMELLNEFMVTLSSKYLSILKCPTGVTWLTSDSPGCTISMDTNLFLASPLLPKNDPDTMFLFPLSKDYCMRFMPFPPGVPTHVTAWECMIEYLEYNKLQAATVNFNTCGAKYNLLISSEYSYLKEFLSIED